MAEEKLWATLRTRKGPDQRGPELTVRVVALEERNKHIFLEGRYEGKPPITVILGLEHNCIEYITLTDVDDPSPLGRTTQKYEDTVEDQSEAVECIREFLQGLEDKVELFLAGPSRVEVEFSALDKPQLVCRAVVHSCLPATAVHQKYSCQVRQWRNKNLDHTSQQINEETHRILSVHRLHCGQIQPEHSNYLPDSMGPRQSFDRLNDVWGRFPHSERAGIYSWNPGSKVIYKGSEFGGHYGGSFYGQGGYGTGYVHKPSPAFLRKAGDESGRKAFQEQEKRRGEGKDLQGLQGVALPEETKSESIQTRTLHYPHGALD